MLEMLVVYSRLSVQVAVSQGYPYVVQLSNHDRYQQGAHLHKRVIIKIVIERGNRNAVIWLQQEVFSNVVNDDAPVEVSAEQGQVFDVEFFARQCMLPVQSVRDAGLCLLTQLRKGPVRVVLHARCKNNNLVVLAKCQQEELCVWPDG